MQGWMAHFGHHLMYGVDIYSFSKVRFLMCGATDYCNCSLLIYWRSFELTIPDSGFQRFITACEYCAYNFYDKRKRLYVMSCVTAHMVSWQDLSIPIGRYI
jgi:hypothetical protein